MSACPRSLRISPNRPIEAGAFPVTKVSSRARIFSKIGYESTFRKPNLRATQKLVQGLRQSRCPLCVLLYEQDPIKRNALFQGSPNRRNERVHGVIRPVQSGADCLLLYRAGGQSAYKERFKE